MSRVLIIGAGGVARVTAFKMASQKRTFKEIMIASRTKSKCDVIARDIEKKYKRKIKTKKINAEDIPALVKLIKSFKPDLLVHLALPYQDLTIMEACLQTKTHYMDTANYEPKDEAKFEYSWQWAYQERFKEAGIMALLGCGFDPGVTGVFTKYAAKHHFDELHYLDIVDCNGGDHGKAFATNFNPEINIREITQNGRYYKNGKWIETQPFEIKKKLTYPNIGKRDSDPGELGENYSGETSIGCRIKGKKDGKKKTYYIWNNCSHQAAFDETGAQGVSYTTGVPAMIGAKMILQKKWKGKGVFNVEEFNPDPFLNELTKHGLEWHEKINAKLEL